MKLKFKPNKKKNTFFNLNMRPVRLKFFNTSKFPKRSQKEWKLIDKDPFGDKDKDRVPNWFDCKPLNKKKQGWVGKGKYKVYSIRPYSETYTGNIHPADTAERMSYGRDTGYFGTGIYGFDTKKQVMEKLAKGTPTSHYDQSRGHIREFIVDKPLVLKTKERSEALFKASKIMNQAAHGDKEKLMHVKYRLQDAGVNATDEEIKQAIEEKSRGWNEKTGNRDQPITRLLKKKGYGGVVPSKEFQNFQHGSVVHVDEEISKDTTPLTSTEKKYKEIAKKLQHESYKRNRKYTGQKDFFEDEDIPHMVTGEWKNDKLIEYRSPKFMDEDDRNMEQVMKKYDKPKKEVIAEIKEIENDVNDNQIPDSAEDIDIKPIHKDED